MVWFCIYACWWIISYIVSCVENRYVIRQTICSSKIIIKIIIQVYKMLYSFSNTSMVCVNSLWFCLWPQPTAEDFTKNHIYIITLTNHIHSSLRSRFLFLRLFSRNTLLLVFVCMCVFSGARASKRTLNTLCFIVTYALWCLYICVEQRFVYISM